VSTVSPVGPSEATEDDRYAGLCARCRHAQRIENDRGSTFYLCGYARIDPAYRKYPPLPVLRCNAYVPPG